jgi:hypothetical protein
MSRRNKTKKKRLGSPKSFAMAGSPMLFARSVLGIYASFLTWGYLQERVTAVDYVDPDGNARRFKNVIFLNLAMGVASALVAFVASKLMGTKPTTSGFSAFAEVSLSNTLASPIGYASLDYISFPMLTLATASKLLPIMVMGILISKKKYTTQNYVSAILITAGIALFSYKPKPAKVSFTETVAVVKYLRKTPYLRGKFTLD